MSAGGAAAAAPPPLRRVRGMGSAVGQGVEGHREGLRVETPAGPLVRLLWRDKATEAVLDFLRSTKVGCLVTLGRPSGEERWRMARAKRVGRSPFKECTFPLFPFLPLLHTMALRAARGTINKLIAHTHTHPSCIPHNHPHSSACSAKLRSLPMARDSSAVERVPRHDLAMASLSEGLSSMPPGTPRQPPRKSRSPKRRICYRAPRRRSDTAQEGGRKRDVSQFLSTRVR